MVTASIFCGPTSIREFTQPETQVKRHMKNALSVAVPSPAIYGGLVFFLLFFIAAGSNQRTSAQSWSPPSLPVNSEVAACYDNVQRGYQNTVARYERQLQRQINTANSHQSTVICAGVAGIVLPPPWNYCRC